MPFEQGRRDLEVLLAAYESGQRNTPVLLPMVVG
jgi:hypothetical protein